MNLIDKIAAKHDFLKPSTDIGNELDVYFRDMPFQIYVKNAQGLYLWGNNVVVSVLSLPSRYELFKKTIFDVCETDCARTTNLNDEEVIKNGQQIACHETALFKNGVRMTVLSQKQPIFDRDKQIVGLVGMSMSVPMLSTNDALFRLRQQGLTPREAEIALAYSKKISAKEISSALDISPRTVQKHIENIRFKLDLNRPSQFYEFIENVLA